MMLMRPLACSGRGVDCYVGDSEAPQCLLRKQCRVECESPW